MSLERELFHPLMRDHAHQQRTGWLKSQIAQFDPDAGRRDPQLANELALGSRGINSLLERVDDQRRTVGHGIVAPRLGWRRMFAVGTGELEPLGLFVGYA